MRNKIIIGLIRKATCVLVLALFFSLLTMAMGTTHAISDQWSATTSSSEKTQIFINDENPNPGYDQKTADLDFRNVFHIALIIKACGYFHDAYLRMPYQLSELVDTGFITFWPGNIYDGGPVKILGNEPDPKNAGQRGNVFYKRTSDHEATITTLILDKNNSTAESTVYKISETEIISATASSISNTILDKNSLVKSGIQMMKMSDIDRIRLAYRNMLSQSLSYIVDDAVRRNNVVEPSFQALLSNGAYYMSEQSVKKLFEMVKKEDLKFAVGYFDKTHSFYHTEYDSEPVDIKCVSSTYNLKNVKTLDHFVAIPKSKPIQVIDQDSILQITLPSGLFITTDDI